MTEKLPAVDCTDWCERGDGHTNVTHPADQYCSSEHRVVTLSRYPLLEVSSGARIRDYAVAVLHRDAGAASTHVSVAHNDLCAFELSPGEARRLGSALLRLAATAGA